MNKKYYDTRNKVKKDAVQIAKVFINSYDRSDNDIMDIITRELGFVDDWGACCDYIDAYADLREVYTCLTYQLNLYRKGVTRLSMFMTVANECANERRENE